MKIKLQFLLNKKRISLKTFCELNDLQSYESLLEYCKKKRFICVDREEFEKHFPSIKKDEKDEPDKSKNKQPAPKTRRRGRKPKAKKSGNVNQKSSS